MSSIYFLLFYLLSRTGNVMNEPDLNKMSDDELQFYYFKIHDSDSNNKLDGSELIKSCKY